MITLPFIFIALAGAFSAVMSSVDNDSHYRESIFSRWAAKFWSKEAAWQAWKIPGTKYTFNAWHIAQSCMYGCFLFAMMSFKPWLHIWWGWAVCVYTVVYGFVLIVPFNLCYNKLFKLK